jgi:hypothetical protein
MVKPPYFCSISPARRAPKAQILRHLPAQRDELGHRIRRHIVGRGKQQRRPRDADDRLHRLRKVELIAGSEVGVDGDHRIRHQEDGVSVGLGARGRLRRDHAVGPRLVLNDDGYFEVLAELLADDPSQGVGLPSRGIADQDRDRSRWIGLRRSRDRDRAQRKSYGRHAEGASFRSNQFAGNHTLSPP